MVFALLGLIGGGGAGLVQGLRPRHLRPGALCEDAICRGDNLGSLCGFRCLPRGLEGLPSWAIDFSRGRRDEEANATWSPRYISTRLAGNGHFVLMHGMRMSYLGLGGPNTKTGDRVWLLGGGNMPFVLRSTDVGRKELDGPDVSLPGDANVARIMEGEAIDTRDIIVFVNIWKHTHTKTLYCSTPWKTVWINIYHEIRTHTMNT